MPFVGGVRLPFFKDFDYRYDLDINIVRAPSVAAAGAAVSYGFDINYTKGLIPYVKYRHPSLITEGDRLEAGTSMGIYYGLDMDFAAVPRYTFIEVETKYHFNPDARGLLHPARQGHGAQLARLACRSGTRGISTSPSCAARPIRASPC